MTKSALKNTHRNTSKNNKSNKRRNKKNSTNRTRTNKQAIQSSVNDYNHNHNDNHNDNKHTKYVLTNLLDEIRNMDHMRNTDNLWLLQQVSMTTTTPIYMNFGLTRSMFEVLDLNTYTYEETDKYRCNDMTGLLCENERTNVTETKTELCAEHSVPCFVLDKLSNMVYTITTSTSTPTPTFYGFYTWSYVSMEHMYYDKTKPVKMFDLYSNKKINKSKGTNKNLKNKTKNKGSSSSSSSSSSTTTMEDIENAIEYRVYPQMKKYEKPVSIFDMYQNITAQEHVNLMKDVDELMKDVMDIIDKLEASKLQSQSHDQAPSQMLSLNDQERYVLKKEARRKLSYILTKLYNSSLDLKSDICDKLNSFIDKTLEEENQDILCCKREEEK
jgi:hypothetical protein